ncbi:MULTISPECIES: NAD(P)/FAD-dependent oxidoreductase [unclassified Sphingomonas]|uniref:NAD(P)/FAD-dependent oxidoreductase n=2 Tax=Sphingomonas TaxID=13687 RepID=UPI001E4056D8|nr:MULTISPECIES: FAD-dependent monooxygenase [unclassified Sphingomonas]
MAHPVPAMRHPRALIIGGGPAGAATAIRLAGAGVETRVLERSTGPHDTVCGGFLGWDALAALDRLGVSAAGLGAHPIRRLRLAHGRRVREVALPFAAAGLSRRVLDEALLARASAAGAGVTRGVKVRSVDPDTRSAELADGTRIIGEALFLATGKHPLRGAPARGEATRDGALGLRIGYVPDATTRAALDGVIELHPFDQGYVGLLLTEDGRVNLCLSSAPARLRAAGSAMALIGELGGESPLLGERVAGLAGQWSTIAGVPYGWRAADGIHGVFRLGDQAAVISSLAGDGVAIALRSGERAAAAMIAGGAPESARYQPRFAREAKRPIATAGALRYAAERPALRPLLFGAMGLGLGLGPWLSAAAARLTRIG